MVKYRNGPELRDQVSLLLSGCHESRALFPFVLMLVQETLRNLFSSSGITSYQLGREYSEYLRIHPPQMFPPASVALNPSVAE